MVGKIDYTGHVLRIVGQNELSTREILDEIRSTVRPNGSEKLYSEVRKALTTGVKNNMLEKRNGKYKLKVNNKKNLQKISSDNRSDSDTVNLLFTDCATRRGRRTGRSKGVGRRRQRSHSRTKARKSTRRSGRRQSLRQESGNRLHKPPKKLPKEITGQASPRTRKSSQIAYKPVNATTANKSKRQRKRRYNRIVQHSDKLQINETSNSTREVASTQERKQSEAEELPAIDVATASPQDVQPGSD